MTNDQGAARGTTHRELVLEANRPGKRRIYRERNGAGRVVSEVTLRQYERDLLGNPDRIRVTIEPIG